MGGVKLDQSQLEARVKMWAADMFGWEVKAPVIISQRMTRAWGYYFCRRTPTGRLKLKSLKFAARLVNGDYPLEAIDDCIKHELIHWYTDTEKGRRCHHNAYFYANCRRFGVNPSRFNNYRKAGSAASY